MQLKNTSLFRLKLILLYTIILIVIFFFARLALYFTVYSFFKELSFSQILISFIAGFRFDIFAICTFSGVFLFLINIPVNCKLFVKINCAFLNVLLLLFSFVLAADIIYFQVFEKHLTTEILLAKSHMSYFLSLAFTDYLFVTVLIAVITGLLFYFSFKTINNKYVPPSKNILFNAISIIVLGCLIIIAVRGGLQERILSISDAYKAGHISGELKLNGVFTSLISIRSKTSPNKIDISLEDAIQTVKLNIIDTDEEIFSDENYPLMRKRIKFNVDGKGYNIVLILLESWQKDYIDSIAGTKYGVTPNFDEIISNSIVYDNFYANGQRSIMGLMSVFFSFPYVQGLPYMGYGLENFEQTKLPLILVKNGYDNVFVQGDKRESDNAVALANYLGFKEAYGKQDIPVANNYLSISKGYDLEGFQFLFKKIKSLKKPFFAFYFTTTTHIPYAKTILKSLEIYPEDGTEKTGYLNRLYYADYALGEFIKRAKNENWFDNTIFIMCSDHQAYGVGGATGEYEKTKVDKTFKIPMIIYCPALFEARVSKELGSQFDIVPTIIDILNIDTPYSSMGKSLFSKTNNRFVFLSYEGEQAYLINNEGIASIDWQKPLNNDIDFDKTNTKLLLAVEKAIYNLVMSNKWYDKNTLKQ